MLDIYRYLTEVRCLFDLGDYEILPKVNEL
jgi:hypothetical protein